VAVVGLAVLLIHNVVDLALEVPAVSIAVFVLIGGLVSNGDGLRGRVVPVLVSVGLPLVCMATVAFGMRTAHADRRQLYQRFGNVKFQQTNERRHYIAAVEQALLRHPADGYLYYLGGLAAHADSEENALAWLARAIERDPQNGAPHLALAVELQRRGATNQALLELRLAAERDYTLIDPVADLARRPTMRAVLFTARG
jgi:tetratricopeptide (TPR) repeat protein